MKLFSASTAAVICSLFIAGCGKADGSSAALAGDPTQSPAASQTADTAKATQAAADPCTFLTKQDLEAAFGTVFTDGTAAQGQPSCSFRSSNDDTVMIALPTSSVSEAEFNSWKQMAGAQAETVSGIGDAAYLWGSRLYVRVGTRTFTISMPDKDLTPQLRTALTSLGQTGASKLR